MRWLTQIGEWFDHRLQLAAPIRDAAEHRVPRNTASWFYVFGSAALTVFMLQIVTGILLALIYVPSAAEAWSSLAGSESRRHSRVVHSRDARMGLEFHGGDCFDSHGAGVFVRGLQVSEGTHVDHRRISFADDTWAWLLAGKCCASIRMLIGDWVSGLLLPAGFLLLVR